MPLNDQDMVLIPIPRYLQEATVISLAEFMCANYSTLCDFVRKCVVFKICVLCSFLGSRDWSFIRLLDSSLTLLRSE